MESDSACGLSNVQAGIIISGINAEVMPGQWEFQIGPVGPLEVGDQVHIARYLLHRLGEKYGISSTFNPKPVKGDWNGTGPPSPATNNTHHILCSAVLRGVMVGKILIPGGLDYASSG